MINENDFLKLIEKITNGTASDEEIKAYQSYFNALQKNEQAFATEEDKSDTKKDIWQNIADKIYRRKSAFRWAAAASVVLLALLTLSGIKLFYGNRHMPDKPDYAVQTNKDGEHSDILLPDSSEVYLNGASSLKYPKTFTGNKREIYLTGEAFFKVKHKQDTAFIVHAGNLVTEDIGTAFNIDAYPGESKVTVTVASGSVRVENGKSKIGVLSKSDRLSYAGASGKATIEKVDLNKALAWTTGRLIFAGETFEEVAASIKRTYNVDIRLNDAIRNCAVYATINPTDMEEDIRLIAESMNATVEKTATGYTIVGGNCS